MIYTKDEMERLNAEFARVAKIQKADDEAARKARIAWNERQRVIEEQMAAERRAEEVRRAERRAEASAYWAKREEQAAKRAAKVAAKSTHSYVRERRSRIDWLEVTGEQWIATRQMHWERRATALAMRKAGLKGREMAERLGVCKARAYQMADQAERESGRRSPGEVWMAEQKINPDMRRWQAVAAVNALQIMPKHDPEADWIWMGLAA